MQKYDIINYMKKIISKYLFKKLSFWLNYKIKDWIKHFIYIKLKNNFYNYDLPKIINYYNSRIFSTASDSLSEYNQIIIEQFLCLAKLRKFKLRNKPISENIVILFIESSIKRQDSLKPFPNFTYDQWENSRNNKAFGYDFPGIYLEIAKDSWSKKSYKFSRNNSEFKDHLDLNYSFLTLISIILNKKKLDSKIYQLDPLDINKKISK